VRHKLRESLSLKAQWQHACDEDFKFSQGSVESENAGPENEGPQKQDRKMEDKCN